MKGILYSICIASLGLALTAQGQQMQGTASANADANAKAKARHTSNVQATTSANTHSAVSTTRSRGNVTSARFHERSSVAARTSTQERVNRNRMRNTSASTRTRARNNTMVNRQRERNIAMTERVKARENANVRVNVNDRTRFTDVTRITSNGQTFDRAVFRDRDDWRLHLGFHDRIFFVNRFSEVVFINGCSFFLNDGIFWPAFIIGESCVPSPNVVFVAVH